MNSRAWAGLAAGIGIGLVLTAAMIAGWSMMRQNEPVRILGNARSLEALIESAPFVVLEEGSRPVTVIAPRASAGLEQWLGEDARALGEKGRQVRAIIVPSGHGGASEESTVAELWLTRSPHLLRQWLDMRAEHWTAVGITPAASAPQRMVSVAEAGALRKAVMQALDMGTSDMRWPVVVWRDAAGQLAVCHCRDEKAVTEARKALGLSERAATVATVPEAVPARAEPTSPVVQNGEAYPRLPDYVPHTPHFEVRGQTSENARPYADSPLLPGDVAPATKAAPPAQTRSGVEQAKAPPRPRPVTTREAPKAEKDAESLFY